MSKKPTESDPPSEYRQVLAKAGEESKKPESEERRAEDSAPARTGRERLIDAAIYNFDTARQYIDEAQYPAEYRLINFHYGIALLADGNDKYLSQAAQCFRDALNWEVDGPLPEQAERHKRILCEANYNLGVVHERQLAFDQASDRYARAIEMAEKPFKEGALQNVRFLGVELLARFGEVSAGIKALKKKEENQIVQEEIKKLSMKISRLEEVLAEARKSKPEPKDTSHDNRMPPSTPDASLSSRLLGALKHVLKPSAKPPDDKWPEVAFSAGQTEMLSQIEAKIRDFLSELRKLSNPDNSATDVGKPSQPLP